MASPEGFNLSVISGLQAHFNQPSGPSRAGTDWTISLANSKGERRIMVRVYGDDVGPLTQQEEARIALEFVVQLLQSGWSPDQYKGTPGELVVPRKAGDAAVVK